MKYQPVWIQLCWQWAREQSLFRINWINVRSWIVCVKFTPVTRLSNQMYPVIANKYPGIAVGK